MSSDPLALKIIQDTERCSNKRTNWETQWRKIGKFFMPFKDDIFQTNQSGQPKGHDLSDGTGVIANDFLASALHSMLTNPSTQWFELSSGDLSLDSRDDVRKYFQDTTRIMHEILTASNYHVEVHEMYLDIGSFGTGVMLMEEDDETIVRFRSTPIYTSYIKENYKGVVDTVYRTYKMTVDNILEVHGKEAFPSHISMEQLLKDSNRELEIIHAVYPRAEKDRNTKSLMPKDMKWASVHVIKEYKKVLKESGFTTFPYIIPRWSKISNEVYGRSPAMKALPDTQMIDAVMRVTLRGGEKLIDPPIQAPDDGMSLPIKNGPSGINYYRSGSPDRIEQMDIKSRPDFGFQLMDDVRMRIKQCFYIDQLQLIDGPQKTATEVMQRREENLRILAPILGRQHNENLKPTVVRLYDICSKKPGILPVAPDVLKEKGFRVQYSSMIARAQKTAEVENLTRFFSVAAPIIQVDQSVLDNFNADEAFIYAANKYNLPQELIRDESDRDKLREARAAAAQKAEAQGDQTHMAEVVQKTANA